MFTAPQLPDDPPELPEDQDEPRRAVDWGLTIGKLCLILGAATLAAMGFGAWYLIHDMQQHMASAASEPAAGTRGSSRGGLVIVALVVLLILRSIWKRLHGK